MLDCAGASPTILVEPRRPSPLYQHLSDVLQIDTSPLERLFCWSKAVRAKLYSQELGRVRPHSQTQHRAVDGARGRRVDSHTVSNIDMPHGKRKGRTNITSRFYE